MKLQETVILKAKTRHGKNRIKQHGDRWMVVRQTEENLGPRFLRPVNALPPWLWLETTDCECPTREKWGQDGRWVSEKNDPNFEIVKDDN